MINQFHKYPLRDLGKLYLSDTEMVRKLFSNVPRYIYARGFLPDAVEWFGLRKTKELQVYLNSTFIEIFRAVQWRQQGDSMFLAFTSLFDLFDDAAKDSIFHLLLQHKQRFTQSCRKRVIEFLISGPMIKDKDPRLEQLFEVYHRSIKPDQFEALMARIDGGQNNPVVLKVLGKSKVFKYLKYTKHGVDSDPAERIKLIKDIATTTTVLKRLPFNIHVGLDDIKQLPPVMRFEFLQFAFFTEIEVYCMKHYRYAYSKPINIVELDKRIEYRKARRKVDKLTIDLIEPDAIKDLLFALCLNRNEVVSAWVERYTKFYNIKTGKQDPDVKRI
jgi:hypothetical protein